MWPNGGCHRFNSGAFSHRNVFRVAKVKLTYDPGGFSVIHTIPGSGIISGTFGHSNPNTPSQP